MVKRAADYFPGMLAATRKAICVSVLYLPHRTFYDVFGANRDAHHRRPSLFRDADAGACQERDLFHRRNVPIRRWRHGLLRGFYDANACVHC